MAGDVIFPAFLLCWLLVIGGYLGIFKGGVLSLVYTLFIPGEIKKPQNQTIKRLY